VTSTRLYTPRFFVVSASHFVLGMGFWMFTLFPLYLAEQGASKAWIGWLVAIEAIAAVAVRPWVGGILEERGRRWVFRTAGVIDLVGVVLYLLVHDISTGLVAVRIIHGIGIGALFAAYFTYAADITPVGRRTEGLAIFGVSGILPSAIAPLLGEELVARFGFQALFAAATAFTAISLALSWNLPDPEPDDEEDETTVSASFWRLAVDRRLTAVWATTLVFSISASAYFAFLAPYAREVGLARVGSFFTCYSLAAVAVRLAGGHLPDRFGARRMLAPPLASLGLGLAVLVALDSPVKLAVAGALCGVGHGYLFPILSGLALEAVDSRGRGAAMSLFTALFDSGQMAGPIVFGGIAELAGYPGMFFAATMLVAVSLPRWIVELAKGSP
jgi:MFS family permease